VREHGVENVGVLGQHELVALESILLISLGRNLRTNLNTQI
jgi:hypothetical protein